jgi:hypothetical protein
MKLFLFLTQVQNIDIMILRIEVQHSVQIVCHFFILTHTHPIPLYIFYFSSKIGHLATSHAVSSNAQGQARD